MVRDHSRARQCSRMHSRSQTTDWGAICAKTRCVPIRKWPVTMRPLKMALPSPGSWVDTLTRALKKPRRISVHQPAKNAVPLTAVNRVEFGAFLKPFCFINGTERAIDKINRLSGARELLSFGFLLCFCSSQATLGNFINPADSDQARHFTYCDSSVIIIGPGK